MSALLRTVLDTQSSEMFLSLQRAKNPLLHLCRMYLEMRENVECLYSSFFLGLERLEML